MDGTQRPPRGWQRDKLSAEFQAALLKFYTNAVATEGAAQTARILFSMFAHAHANGMAIEVPEYIQVLFRKYRHLLGEMASNNAK